MSEQRDCEDCWTDGYVEGSAHLAAAVKLAREAANGWACYAKRRREHEEITRIHRALDELEGRKATDV